LAELNFGIAPRKLEGRPAFIPDCDSGHHVSRCPSSEHLTQLAA
jgi:hypothetical protein